VTYVIQVAAFLHAFSGNPSKLFFSDIYKMGKALANYPQELAQDAVCQSHTGHMTELWFLSVRPLIKSTNEWMDTCARHIVSLMFIGRCLIVIVEEWKTDLMSLAILFHFLCAQHVSGINIAIIRSLWLCYWITTSVVLFSVRSVLEFWCGWLWVLFCCSSACNSLFLLHLTPKEVPSASYSQRYLVYLFPLRETPKLNKDETSTHVNENCKT